jgi:hypothetical protein
MRTLRRFTHIDEADFTLDEVISSSADHNDTFAADAQRRATLQHELKTLNKKGGEISENK